MESARSEEEAKGEKFVSDSGSSSTETTGHVYDVFMSFRGQDTRNTFTDHLYTSLYMAGINVFQDSMLFRGDTVGSAIFKAIEQSSICIAILSENYASSKWCLNELAFMMERMDMGKQVILPVFYNIEPHHARHQTGSYAAAFRRHEKTIDPLTVERWRKALKFVASITGWVLKESDSSERLIKSIVGNVMSLLKKQNLRASGTDDKVEEIVNLLQIEVNDIRMLAIQGVGGVGKTTLAKTVFNQISNSFDGCAFLADVRETIELREDDGFQVLQAKLISDIQRRDCEQIHSVDEGIMVIEETCSDIKVLIVLDDISLDDGFHLEKLIGKLEYFGHGSRIIMTTRSKHGIPQMACTYEVQNMPHWEAYQLFAKHACMGYPHSYDEKILLSQDIVLATGGIPLIVEVIGSFLFDKAEEVWEDTLMRLEETKEVQEKLMISVQALDQQQKQIFLDIACFLDGEDSRVASYIWDDCVPSPCEVVQSLCSLSLVKIEDNHVIRMHDELKVLGTQLAFQGYYAESHVAGKLHWIRGRDFGKFARMEDIEKVAALGLISGDQAMYQDAEFRKMPSLRFLYLEHADIVGDFHEAFPSLTWFHWEGFPLEFKATNFLLKNLVILNLSKGKVTSSWEGWEFIKMATKLKVLNLTACDHLIVTPDFSGYPRLERLILERCCRLVEIHPSIRYLESLEFLSLKSCKELHSLPKEIKFLTELKHLIIDETSLQDIPHSIGHIEKLQTLSASNCSSLTQFPSSVSFLKYLSELSLDDSNISELPSSTVELLQLQKLSLRNCKWLSELPDDIGSLGGSLLEMDVSGTGISELPDSIRRLGRLRVLKMESSFIKAISSTVGHITSLEVLLASHCRNLGGVVPDSIVELKSLKILRLGYTHISALPSKLCELPHLEILDLISCDMLNILPDLPSSLTSLHYSCEGFRNIPHLLSLNRLEELVFGDSGFEELVYQKMQGEGFITFEAQELEFPHLPKLKELDICLPYISSIRFEDFHKLRKLVLSCPILDALYLPRNLVSLSIQSCWLLKILNVEGLRTLAELQIQDSAVREIQGLRKLHSLCVLGISNSALESLDGLEELTSLWSLMVCSCNNLSGLPEIKKRDRLRVIKIQSCKMIGDIEDLTGLTSLAASLTHLESKHQLTEEFAESEFPDDIADASTNSKSTEQQTCKGNLSWHQSEQQQPPEISSDPGGADKLEKCVAEEETDKFKLPKFGTAAQIKEPADQLTRHVLPTSLQNCDSIIHKDQPSLAGSRSNGPLVGNANRAPMGPEPGNPHGISNYSESNHNTLPSLGQSNPINVSPQVATTTSNAQGFTNDLSSRIDSNISNHRVNSMIRELQEEVRPNALSHAGLNVPPTNTGDIHENMMLEHNDPMQVEREFVNARESPQPSSSSSSIAMESRRREIFELAPHTVGRDHIVDEICHSLMDQILCIGVYGMGGVGKTTIMKRLDDKVRGDAAFGKVLWVTVSQDCSLHELQNKLSMALKVTDDFGTIDIVERPTFLNGHLRERGKTLIILDDLWQHYNLNELGIKLTRDGGIQLVLTTRHQDVCQRMMCEKEFEVKCLPDDDAMNLFEKTLGYEMSDSRKGIAKDIIGKCRGLPLAIVVIAAHMRGVDSDHGWHSTLERLRHPEEVEAQHFMVKEVFPILHHSYKELNGRQQQCFLLCALYPEDWEIQRHQLIELYIDEGVIREDSRWKMYNEANHMLDELEKKCLLEKVVDDGPLETDEQGEVRMHDVIRDLALHIMNSKGTCIVKCHIPLDEIPVMDDGSRDLQKVSLVRNSFMKELPSLQSNCPKLSTLLVSGCYNLSEIPECFFERAEGLKVVDISSTAIATVPGSIIKLKILNALILRGCRKLLSVPNLATLTSLRKLDLRRCELIDAVPEGLEMLVNLTYLDLSWTSIEEIKAGVVGKLQKLQHLGLGCVAVHGKEVATLKKLEIMSCRFKEMNELSDYMQHRQHESTLKAYALLIGDDNNTNWGYCIDAATGVYILEDNFHWRWDMKAVILERVNYPGETLHIPSDVKTLDIQKCEELKSITEEGQAEEGKFTQLQSISISRCPKMRRLLTLELFTHLPNLDSIHVSECDGMKEVIGTESEHAPPPPSLSSRKSLSILLDELPELESISNWPHIRSFIHELRIERCPKLKRIPFLDGFPIAPPFLEKLLIDSYEQWESMEWEHPQAKHALEPYVFIVSKFNDEIPTWEWRLLQIL